MTFVTSDMHVEDPDSILEAVLLMSVNGGICPVDDPKKCDECSRIWAAIDERLHRYE